MGIGSMRRIDRWLFGILALLLGPPVKVFSANRMPEKIDKILVIKLWAIGDAVLTLPLIRGIRKRLPASRIDVLCHRANRAVYEASGDIDGIVEFGIRNLPGLFKKYDICFDTEPYLNLSALIAAWSARGRVGFRNRFRWLFYDRTVSPEPDVHAVEKYLEMGRHIGVEADRNLVPLRFPDEAGRRVETLLGPRRPDGEELLVGMCASVGKSVKARQWPRECFRQLAARILAEWGKARIVLIGTEEDVSVNEFIRDGHPGILDLSGKIGLPELFCLAARLDAFVSNDTGPMHVAAAQGVPTLGIFGPSSPELWRPYGDRNRYLYRGKEVCCLAPCNVPQRGLVRECRLRGEDRDLCIRSIPVDEVFRELREMMEPPAGGTGKPAGER